MAEGTVGAAADGLIFILGKGREPFHAGGRRNAMATITEIGPEIYRICTYVPEADLQFNQFLLKGDEPLLFHTGLRAHFPEIRAAVAQLIPPDALRWIAFSHYEADECATLNQWLELAPRAEPLCSFIAAVVSVNDIALRPARTLRKEEVLALGRHRVRLLQTPQVPHAWDAGLLFEETTQTLLCSDLFHQLGDRPAVTTDDVVARMREALLLYEQGPLAAYLPYTARTGPILQRLADLRPRLCATMHGSAYAGDGADAIRRMAEMLRDVAAHP
jgi:flavorubredoxin